MRKTIAILILFLFTLNFSSGTNLGRAKLEAKPNIKTEAEVEITASKLDKEAEILAQYLAQHNSPLQYHAKDFIDAAKAYGLDWKLVPAIAGVESTFGKFIPGGYNGWGWGVYGAQAIYFKSWKEAIFTISKGLKEDYIDQGLRDPNSINRKYAASRYWGANVSYFMKELEQFKAGYQLNQKSVSLTDSTPKIAAVSAGLMLR